MTEHATRGVGAKLLSWLLTGVALGALLMPLFGPLLDHHFPERQPHHAHVYLGSVVPDHVHPYQAPDHDHGHHHSHDAGGGFEHGGIVFLTSSDGVGQSVTAATIQMGQESLAFPIPGGNPLGYAGPLDAPPLRDALVSLSKKPPRA